MLPRELRTKRAASQLAVVACAAEQEGETREAPARLVIHPIPPPG